MWFCQVWLWQQNHTLFTCPRSKAQQFRFVFVMLLPCHFVQSETQLIHQQEHARKICSSFRQSCVNLSSAVRGEDWSEKHSQIQWWTHTLVRPSFLIQYSNLVYVALLFENDDTFVKGFFSRCLLAFLSEHQTQIYPHNKYTMVLKHQKLDPLKCIHAETHSESVCELSLPIFPWAQQRVLRETSFKSILMHYTFVFTQTCTCTIRQVVLRKEVVIA